MTTIARLVFVSESGVFGEIAPDQARQCADWLRKHFPHAPLVEFFERVAEHDGPTPQGAPGG